MMYRSPVLASLLFIVAAACQAQERNEYPTFEPKWEKPIVQVNLMQLSWYAQSGAQLEFSRDNSFLCAYGYYFGNTHCAVFDVLTGSVQPVTTSTGYLSPKFEALFTRAAMISSSYLTSFYASYKEEYNRGLLKNNIYADLLEKSDSWKFNKNRSECLILVDSLTVELWQLTPERKRLWSQKIPQGMRDWQDAAFYLQHKKDCIIIAAGDQFHILEHETGKVIQTITYGDRLSVEQLEARANLVDPNHNIPSSEKALVLEFKGAEVEVEPEQKLLAAGESQGRRIRVISLEPPYKAVAELNALDNPCSPKGANWCVVRVNFAGGHYLIVEYAYHRRSWYGTLSYDSTDIFDTHDWKRVWHENCQPIKNVAISPDGKKLAFIRGNILEIGDFNPIK